MARLYAGILGLLALVTTLALGLLQGRPADAILFSAWLSLLVFAVVGYLLGSVAGRLVDESFETAIADELAIVEAKKQTPPDGEE